MESFKPILYKVIKIVFITGLLVRFRTTVFVSVRSCQLNITVRWRTSSWYFYPACLASWLTRWWWLRVPTQSLCLRLPSPSVPTTRASKLSDWLSRQDCGVCSSGWRNSTSWKFIKKFCGEEDMNGETVNSPLTNNFHTQILLTAWERTPSLSTPACGRASLTRPSGGATWPLLATGCVTPSHTTQPRVLDHSF